MDTPRPIDAANAFAARAVAYELRIGVTGHRRLSTEQMTAVDVAVRGLLDRIEQTLAANSAQPISVLPGSWRSASGCITRIGAHVDQVLTAIVRTVWRSIPRPQRRVPEERQTPLRWIVVSPLAKGADRIVAQAVLDRKPPPLDLEQVRPRLEVILPMPVAEYRRDFQDPEDLKEFDRLFDQAAWTNADDERLLTDVRSGALRNSAYRMAGHEVANRCDLLIAVWDGELPAGGGGTGEIVPYAVRQGRPVLWINSRTPTDEPLLLTNRKTDRPWPTSGGDDPMNGVFLDEFPRSAKELSLGFHRLAAFQRDTGISTAEYVAKVDKYAASYEKLVHDFGLSPATGSAVVKQLLPHLACADILATRYQKLYLSAVNLIYLLALAAITSAVVQQIFLPSVSALGALEVSALLAAWSLLRVGRREQWQQKYHNDRYLAEWLRRAQFTVLPPPGGFIPSAGQLSLYLGPETWFVRALGRVIEAAADDIHGPKPIASSGESDGTATAANSVASSSPPTDTDQYVGPLPQLKAALTDGWAVSQAVWHAHKAHQEEHHALKGRNATFWLFVATLSMAVVHWRLHLHGRLGDTVTLLAIILPACAAALHSIERVRDHERTAARSRQMAKLLDRLSDRLRSAETWDELLKAAREVDETMAEEVEEWWVAGTLQYVGEPV